MASSTPRELSLAMAPSDMQIDVTPPVFVDKHIYLAYGDNQVTCDWARGMVESLEANGYIVEQGEGGITPDQLAEKIKRCLKVVMLIDRYVTI